jgi:hypothetical protein
MRRPVGGSVGTPRPVSAGPSGAPPRTGRLCRALDDGSRIRRCSGCTVPSCSVLDCSDLEASGDRAKGPVGSPVAWVATAIFVALMASSPSWPSRRWGSATCSAPEDASSGGSRCRCCSSPQAWRPTACGWPQRLLPRRRLVRRHGVPAHDRLISLADVVGARLGGRIGGSGHQWGRCHDLVGVAHRRGRPRTRDRRSITGGSGVRSRQRSLST